MTQPTQIGYTGCTCYQVLGQSLARKGKRKAMSIEYVYPVIEEFDGGKVILDEERDPILRPRFTTFVQVGDSLPQHWDESSTRETAAGQATKLLKLLRRVTKPQEGCTPQDCKHYHEIKLTVTFGDSDPNRPGEELAAALLALIKQQPIESAFMGHARVDGVRALSTMRVELRPVPELVPAGGDE
ncbi:hypothetical protein UFOVP650_39 [uncultured Caudovirales phage]|uniref:Uncharacterized protein n=1 Tax=uncultured Caudovirales phage TaxID=2100421 RepID=A0A6J5NCU1_9CAUD|nr:hypothetical protein UFOVP650_39 [uncultured Caudovirales phage]